MKEHKTTIEMQFDIQAAGTAFLKDYKRLFRENQLLRDRIDQLMNGGNTLSARVRESVWLTKHKDDRYITSAIDEWESLFHEMFQEMEREEGAEAE
jgi:hypothetical protein